MKANKTMKTQTSANTPARGVKPASNGNGSHPAPNMDKVSAAVAKLEGKSNGQPKVDAAKAAALTALTEAWENHAEAGDALKVALEAAVKAGVSRAECVKAGVDSGYSESWANQLVCHALDKANPQRNKTRVGRKTGKEAKELAAYAVKQYGDEAKATLLAAYRWLKK